MADVGKPASPAVDRSALLARLGGDEELLRDVVRLFLVDCPARLAAIKSAIEGRDADRVRTEAHALKGAASNMSAPEIVEAARALERMGAEGKLDAADGALRQLSNAADAALDLLRQSV